MARLPAACAVATTLGVLACAPERIIDPFPDSDGFAAMLLARARDGHPSVRAISLDGSPVTVSWVSAAAEDEELAALLYEGDLTSLGIDEGVLSAALPGEPGDELPPASEVRVREPDSGWRTTTALPDWLASFRMPSKQEPCARLSAESIVFSPDRSQQLRGAVQIAEGELWVSTANDSGARTLYRLQDGRVEPIALTASAAFTLTAGLRRPDRVLVGTEDGTLLAVDPADPSRRLEPDTALSDRPIRVMAGGPLEESWAVAIASDGALARHSAQGWAPVPGTARAGRDAGILDLLWLAPDESVDADPDARDAQGNAPVRRVRGSSVSADSFERPVPGTFLFTALAAAEGTRWAIVRASGGLRQPHLLFHYDDGAGTWRSGPSLVNSITASADIGEIRRLVRVPGAWLLGTREGYAIRVGDEGQTCFRQLSTTHLDIFQPYDTHRWLVGSRFSPDAYLLEVD